MRCTRCVRYPMKRRAPHAPRRDVRRAVNPKREGLRPVAARSASFELSAACAMGVGHIAHHLPLKSRAAHSTTCHMGRARPSHELRIVAAERSAHVARPIRCQPETRATRPQRIGQGRSYITYEKAAPWGGSRIRWCTGQRIAETHHLQRRLRSRDSAEKSRITPAVNCSTARLRFSDRPESCPGRRCRSSGRAAGMWFRIWRRSRKACHPPSQHIYR